MEFWGVEVKSGEPVSVCPEDGKLIHISQAALGEVKNVKAANYVPIRLKVGDKKFVIGTLSAERGPQISFDLVLQNEFELSHDWKDGSIYFCGYTAEEQGDGQSDHDSSDEDDDDVDEIMLKNFTGKPAPDTQVAKPAKTKDAVTKAGSSAKPKVTLVEPEKEESDDSDESEDGSDDESDDDDDDLEDDSDDDMSEDEETPKKAEPSKKRSADSAIKTPASSKKAKTGTPQKTDGKKGSGHTATPHPAKKTEKKTAETPKSSGSVSCKTCSKTFGSEKGLESHTKAKHGGK